MAKYIASDKDSVFNKHDESSTSSDSNASVGSLRTDNKASGRKPQQCRYCMKQYINSGGLWKHEKRCTKNENAKAEKNTNGNYNCQICKQSFRYSTGLAKHMKRHSESGFICKQCGAKFHTDAERKIHKETNHNVIKCQLCEKTFQKEDEFFMHINSEHEGRDRVYAVCSDCGQQFRTNVQLKYHMESKCGTQKQWICEECNSRFMTKSTLRAHKLIHEGDKKHLCNYCGNSFLSKGQLKVHERSHTGEKPFVCEICNKGFAYRESLVTHSSLHTGIKPYLCEGCGSRFSCIGNLIKHRKARPDSCGLPQFSTNTKVAPRASAKRTRARRPKGARKRSTIAEIIRSKKEKFPNPNTENVNINSLSVFPNSEYADYNFQNSNNPFETNKGWSFEQKTNTEEFGNLEELLYGNRNEAEISKIKTEIELMDCPVNVDVLNRIKMENNSLLNGAKNGKDDSNNGNENTNHHKKEVKEDILKWKNCSRTKDNCDNNEVINENKNDKKHRTRSKTAAGKAKVKEELLNESNDHAFSDNEFQVYESDDEICLSNIENKTEKGQQEDNVELPANIFYPTESKSGRPLFSCKFCLKEYAYLSALSKHEKTHEKMIEETEDPINKSVKSKESYRCKFCHKKYLNLSVLIKHEKEHGPEGNLLVRCSCCRKYFETRDKCLAHQARVHFDRLTCTQCNKIFKEPDNLTAHMKHTHGKGNVKKYTYVCPTCGKRFSSKLALLDHEVSRCGSQPAHTCPTCSRRYASAASLRAHRTVHSGLLAHLCRYCGKAFRTRGQVKVHERGHSGEKPYKCEFCPKAFAYRESLITHRSLHTGIKRHLCHGCGARFSCISNLQAHRKSHKNTCGITT